MVDLPSLIFGMAMLVIPALTVLRDLSEARRPRRGVRPFDDGA